MDRPETDSLLRYKVHGWSSYSANYMPENILHNEPTKQSSRWSSGSNFHPQFLILKLHRPSIVRNILFGKYEKSHVCNLKKFKILGGLEENSLIELKKGGLRNDHNPEIFELKHINDEHHPFACRYIKIVPLLSWGTAFNFSIWYIELWGTDKSEIVQPYLKLHYERQEHEATRLCLKHFRQRNFVEAFHSLQKKTNVRLEHPMLTELHNKLVIEGDFQECERIIERAVQRRFFASFTNRQEYKARWTNISVKSFPQPDGVPGMRGGHQMCMDYNNNHVYLLGGWDGTADLSDFWRFEVDRSTWVCLSRNMEAVGGPSARSCHKICIDCENGRIYTLGRYIDSAKRSALIVVNDFHVYHTLEDRWEMISADTAAEGGPKLIFDHQMCIDQSSQMIYVFGGRILSANLTTQTGLMRPAPEFSGLYQYHIPTNTWQLLREDSGDAGPQDVRSRIGHSMLLDTVCHVLYIFGGQRSKEYMNDFFMYDIEKDSVTVIHDGSKKDETLPPSGFTQRATINSELGEIHMLSGLSKDKEKREDNMHNALWIYVIGADSWTCVYRNDVSSAGGASCLRPSNVPSSNTEPCPRYAHQLVYDPHNEIHYMFGGNPGSKSSPKKRLSDFWSLELLRPTQDDLLKKCKYMIRKRQFKEEAIRNPMSAMVYLQNCVSEFVTHGDPREEREFQLLATSLFGRLSDSEDESSSESSESYTSTLRKPRRSIPNSSTKNLKYTGVDDFHVERTMLFNDLSVFFPDNMTQPSGDLTDMVPF